MSAKGVGIFLSGSTSTTSPSEYPLTNENSEKVSVEKVCLESNEKILT